jgi:hypothetical protein
LLRISTDGVRTLNALHFVTFERGRNIAIKRRIAFALAVAGINLAATSAFAATTDEGAPAAGASLPADTAAAAVAATSVDMSLAVDDPSTGEGGGDVEVAFTPYLWMAGINGDIAIPRNDSEADVDRSFGDILGDLKFAFMGTLDVKYRRLIVHTDLIYMNLGADIKRVDSLIFTEGEFDYKQTIATGAIGYRVVDRGPMFIDLYAGGRLISLDVDLALEGPLQTREANASPSNVSPLVGGKARFPLSDRWALALQGDIGFDSDVKWQLAGSIQYELGKHWRAGVGYRHLQLHHDSDDSEFDISFSGPLIAFTYLF